jgi:hypothetical protein
MQVRLTALMLHPALEAPGIEPDESAVNRSLDAAVHSLCQRLKQLQVATFQLYVMLWFNQVHDMPSRLCSCIHCH